MRNVADFLKAPSTPKIHYIGIELSDRLRWVSDALHENAALSLYATWRDPPKATHPRFAFSLGVANYAFSNSAEFTDWLMQNRVAVVREKFSTKSDFAADILGKRVVCFDAASLEGQLAARGYKTIILSCAESQPFLDVKPPEETAFFNAYVMVHNLLDAELATLANLMDRYEVSRFAPYWDGDPPLFLSSEQISAPRRLSQIPKEIAWKRDYKRRSLRTLRRKFDFADIANRQDFHAHLSKIDRLYGSRQAKRLELFGVPRWKITLGLKALTGDKHLRSRIWGRIRSRFGPGG